MLLLLLAPPLLGLGDGLGLGVGGAQPRSQMGSVAPCVAPHSSPLPEPVVVIVYTRGAHWPQAQPGVQLLQAPTQSTSGSCSTTGAVIVLVSAVIAAPPGRTTAISVPLAASVVTSEAAWLATDKGATSAQSTTTDPPLIPWTTMASVLTPPSSAAIDARKPVSNSARSGLPSSIVSIETGKVRAAVTCTTSSGGEPSGWRCAVARAISTRSAASATSVGL